MNLKSLVLLGVALLLTHPLQAATDYPGKADAFLRRMMAENQFNGAVRVQALGKEIFSGAYGLANREFRVPNSPETRFAIASVSKQILVACLLKMQEEGRLNVQHPISKYVAVPPIWSGITFHHLMTHTSGIRWLGAVPQWDGIKHHALTPAQLVDIFKTVPLVGPPGAQYEYSDTGYTVLAWVLETMTGQRLDAILGRYVFGPLRMRDSGRNQSTTVIPGLADGYETPGPSGPIFKGGIPPAHSLENPVNFAGAGDLFSTTRNLMMWDFALRHGGLLTSASLAAMFTPHNPTAEPGVAYGYGWFRQSWGGHDVAWHTGSLGGYGANVVHFMNEDFTVIVLMNLRPRGWGEGARGIGRKLAELYWTR